MYGSEIMLWKEKERSRISAVQMDNLRELLGIRRIDRDPSERIREFCGVKKGLEKIDKGVLRWFGHVERMENDRMAKRICVGECVGSRLVGRPRKRGIDSVNECLKKRGLNVGEQEGRGVIGMNGEIFQAGMLRAYPGR